MSDDGQLSQAAVPPPPPPPPPISQPAPSCPSSSFKVESDKSSQIELENLLRAQWLSKLRPQKVFSYCNYVPSIVQQGPQCGLVALSMASQLLDATSQLTPDLLFAAAVERGYTKQGEMFSASSMAKLIMELAPVTAHVHHDLSISKRELLSHMAQGWPALVPYDADGNHEPVNKRGHKAHWALLLGFCLLSDCTVPTAANEQHGGDQASTVIEHLSPKTAILTDTFFNMVDSKVSKATRLIIYAKQGKSKYVRVWQFDALCDSNKNLMEVDPKLDDVNYIIPKNRDLSQLLCDQFLLIKPIDR